jgi:general secretion pathway protein F
VIRESFMSQRSPLTIGETAALLNEVAACVRAQVPIEAGLATLETRAAGRVALAAEAIRTEIESGVAIEEAISRNLHQHGEQIASALNASRSGRDAGAALQQLADMLLQRREMRLRGLTAMIYPIVVVVMSYVILVFVFASIVRLHSSWFEWPGFIAVTGNWLAKFWWIPPLVLLALAMVVRITGMRKWLPGAWLPSEWSNQSLFCEAVAWQLESQTPLPAALRAAAEFTGNTVLKTEATGWADAVQRGALADYKPSGFRPLVVWTLQAGSDSHSIARALRRLAATYRQTEMRTWRTWSQWLPATVASVVGGATILAYIAGVVWPLYHRLSEL